MNWRRARSLFPVTRELVYLNHAGVAPISSRVEDALARYAAEAVRRGIERTERSFAVPATLSRETDLASYALPNGGRLHVVPRRAVPVVEQCDGLLSEFFCAAHIATCNSGLGCTRAEGGVPC